MPQLPTPKYNRAQCTIQTLYNIDPKIFLRQGGIVHSKKLQQSNRPHAQLQPVESYCLYHAADKQVTKMTPSWLEPPGGVRRCAAASARVRAEDHAAD